MRFWYDTLSLPLYIHCSTIFCFLNLSSNLNKGALFRSAVHAWYKRGSPMEDAAEAIDDIVVIFGEGKVYDLFVCTLAVHW